MDKTSLEILKLLFKNYEMTIDINELSKIYCISSRWIRKCILDINYYLNKNDLGNIIIDKNILIPNFKNIDKLNENIKYIDYYSYKMSKTERIILLQFYLLNTKEISLNTYCEKFFVSESTYKRDISELKEEIKKYNLKYISKSKLIKGKEEDKRKLIKDLLKKGIIKKELDEIYKINLLDIYEKLKVGIEKILKNKSNIEIENILLYIYISINRIELFKSKLYEDEFYKINNLKIIEKNKEYEEIKDLINKNYNIEMNIKEIEMLKKIVENTENKKDDFIRIQVITKLFIDNISKALNVKLSNDFLFYENLTNHIYSMILKSVSNPLDNLLFKNIIEENKIVKQAVHTNLEILKKHIGRELSEVEINYIIIHVCAALERKKHKKIKLNVGIYCNLRENAKLFMMNILKNNFNFNLYEVNEEFKLKNSEEIEIDFYISNEILKNNKDYIYVSDDLRDEDYIKIGNEISRILRLQEEEKMYLDPRMSDILYDEIINLVKNEKLEKEIKEVIKKYTKKIVNINKNEMLLSHFLNDDYIYTDVEIKDLKDGIKYGCKILEEKGDVLGTYAERIIKNIDDNGTYIVISEGFAFPHASVGKDNFKTSMILLKLKEMIEYEEIKNIKYICILSAVDKDSHIKAFFNLVKMLKDQMFRYELDRAETKKEIRNVIRYYEMLVEE